MSWLTLQIGSLLLNSANSVLDKRLVRDHEPNPVMYLASFAVVGVPVVAIGLVVVPWPGYQAAGIGLFNGLIFTMIVLLYYRAMGLEDVSRLIPVLRLSNLLSLIFLALFQNDQLSVVHYLAAGLMTAGTLALSWKHSETGQRARFYISQGIALMSLVALLSAVSGVLDAHLNLTYSPLVLLVWTKAGNVLGMAIVLLVRQQREVFHRTLTASSPRFRLLVVGEQIGRLVTGILSDFAVQEAGSAAIVSVVGGLRPFLVMLLAVIFLRERFGRQELPPKLVGIGLITAGTSLLLIG
ncbi:MAG: EamA family transporter [Ardenticatenaceae bacterium]|nr:EamA family transporter [Ardenticatenaceae bacterium]